MRRLSPASRTPFQSTFPLFTVIKRYTIASYNSNTGTTRYTYLTHVNFDRIQLNWAMICNYITLTYEINLTALTAIEDKGSPRHATPDCLRFVRPSDSRRPFPSDVRRFPFISIIDLWLIHLLLIIKNISLLDSQHVLAIAPCWSRSMLASQPLSLTNCNWIPYSPVVGRPTACLRSPSRSPQQAARLPTEAAKLTTHLLENNKPLPPTITCWYHTVVWKEDY